MPRRRIVFSHVCLLAVLTLRWPAAAVGQTCLHRRPRRARSGFAVLELTGGIRLDQKPRPTGQDAALALRFPSPTADIAFNYPIGSGSP